MNHTSRNLEDSGAEHELMRKNVSMLPRGSSYAMLLKTVAAYCTFLESTRG